MFIHDIIKIQLSRDGYLPNYPPHLISDAEMCDAFLPYVYVEDDPTFGYDISMDTEINYFRDNYPVVDDSLLDAHKKLVSEIAYHINVLKNSTEDNPVLPDWVYSYMLGYPISINSNKKDIHDLIYPLGVDNLDDDFNADCMVACNIVSLAWIRSKTLNAAFTIPENYRTAITDLLSDFWFNNGTNAPQKEMISVYSAPFAYNYDISDPSKEYVFKSANTVCDRPPTIFGEPHIIKSNRLKQSGE